VIRGVTTGHVAFGGKFWSMQTRSQKETREETS